MTASILRPFLVLAALTMSLSAHARLSDVAREILTELRFGETSLTSSQKAEIQGHLDAIVDILMGQSQPNQNFTCVSRDNDGQNPWMLASREFNQVNRIAGTVVKTKAECENLLISGRKISGGTMLCVSRDNDGQNPYALAILKGSSLSKLPKAVSRTLGDCQQTMRDLKKTQEGMIFCASRDSDGAAPFVTIGIRRDLSASVGNETFRSYEDCTQSISRF